MESVVIKQLKEKICQGEANLRKLIEDNDKLWEDTGLDPKESSYLVEKTMRFELAQKNIKEIAAVFKEITESYRKLCQELEKATLKEES